MYCSNCGKFIEGDAKLCKECEAELNKTTAASEDPIDTATDTTSGVPPYGYDYYNQGYYQPSQNGYYCDQPEPQNRMYGFGKALTSAILSFFGVLFAYVAMVAGLIEPAVGVVLLLISLPCTVVSFIFGLKSINTFRARKATCVKPIPTLILGIEGISSSGAALLMAFLALLMIAIGGVI